MEPGDKVEILSPYDGRCLQGFELAMEEHDEDGQLVGLFVRRTSDRQLLIWRYGEDEVRPERLTPTTTAARFRRAR